MTGARPTPAIVSIGVLTFDAERRLLTGPGGPVPLSSKQFELLSLLASHRPKAVSKEVILDALWHHTSVAETSLTTLVKELRNKLGQEGREGPVRTVHGFGYALEDEGEPALPSSLPRLLRGKTEIRVVSSELVLGREPGLPGTIDDASVSRFHARVGRSGPGVLVEDLGSKNGTFVNGARIAGPVALEDGDEIRLGLVSFVYRAPRSGLSTTKSVR